MVIDKNDPKMVTGIVDRRLPQNHYNDTTVSLTDILKFDYRKLTDNLSVYLDPKTRELVCYDVFDDMGNKTYSGNADNNGTKIDVKHEFDKIYVSNNNSRMIFSIDEINKETGNCLLIYEEKMGMGIYYLMKTNKLGQQLVESEKNLQTGELKTYYEHDINGEQFVKTIESKDGSKKIEFFPENNDTGEQLKDLVKKKDSLVRYHKNSINGVQVIKREATLNNGNWIYLEFDESGREINRLEGNEASYNLMFKDLYGDNVRINIMPSENLWMNKEELHEQLHKGFLYIQSIGFDTINEFSLRTKKMDEGFAATWSNNISTIFLNIDGIEESFENDVILHELTHLGQSTIGNLYNISIFDIFPKWFIEGHASYTQMDNTSFYPSSDHMLSTKKNFLYTHNSKDNRDIEENLYFDYNIGSVVIGILAEKGINITDLYRVAGLKNNGTSIKPKANSNIKKHSEPKSLFIDTINHFGINLDELELEIRKRVKLNAGHI